MATFFKTVRKTVKHWYIPGIIGLIFVLFGIYIMATPLESYAALAFLFSLSFLFSGILAIWFSIDNRSELEGWGWHLAGGIFLFLIGIMLIAQPEMAAITLSLFVGFTLLFHSIQGLGFAFDLKNYGISRWGYLALASVLGILFSIILIFNPVFTGLSLVVMTSLAFIFSGIGSIILSYHLMKLKNTPRRIRKELLEKIEDLKEEYYEAIGKRD